MTIQDILQDRKKLLIIGGAALVLVVIIILLFSSISNPQVQNNDVISSIILAKGETSDKKAVNPTEIFSINDSEIHAIVSFNSVAAQSTVLYQWYDVKNEKSIKDDSRTTQSVFSGISSASLVRDTESEKKIDWGVGDYELRISLNGKLLIKKPYKVRTDQEIEKNQVLSSIKNIQLTTAVDLEGKPTRSVSSVFSKDDENIYASITFENMPKKVEFEGRWLYLNSETLIEKYQKSILGSGTFSFGMNSKRSALIPTQKWPTGKYRLEIYLDNEKIDSIDFDIE